MRTWIIGYSGGAHLVGATPRKPRVKPVKIATIKDTVSLLEPETKALYLQLEDSMMSKYGIGIRRGRTRATIEMEKGHAEKGRSAMTSGISWHLLGRAIDVYPIDPATGKPDMMARNIDLFRKLHREWHALGGTGLAFLPYPEGPVRKLKTPDGRVFYDLGHLEFHGPHPNLASAYAAEKHTLSAFV